MASPFDQERYQHYSSLRNGSADSESEMAKHQGLSNNDLMQAALDGDLEATYQLGCRFLTGSHGVSVNAAQAIKWLQKAADEGHSDAQTNLGSCYMHGRGVPPSADKAVKMYRKASAKKNINGMYNLGEDCDVAIQWFYKYVSNLPLVLYEKGSGLTIVQDLETAVMWYGRAAKQGHPYGMFNLATCYAHARGVEQDQVLAYKWLSAASEHGHQDAQEVLARCLSAPFYLEAKELLAGDIAAPAFI
eukprot:gene16248-19283_t